MERETIDATVFKSHFAWKTRMDDDCIRYAMWQIKTPMS